MKVNVGGADRAFRLAVGLVLLSLGIFAPLAPFWRALDLVAAAVALLTWIVRYCPVNSLLGIDTSLPSSRSDKKR